MPRARLVWGKRSNFLQGKLWVFKYLLHFILNNLYSENKTYLKVLRAPILLKRQHFLLLTASVSTRIFLPVPRKWNQSAFLYSLSHWACFQDRSFILIQLYDRDHYIPTPNFDSTLLCLQSTHRTFIRDNISTPSLQYRKLSIIIKH